MRGIRVGIVGLMYVPAVMAAFPSTDDIVWPAEGKYAGYPAEPDERRIRFSATAGLHHDSNIFRLSDSTDPQTAIGSSQKSDTVRQLGVGVKGDIPVSRQRFLFDALVEDYHFSHFGLLNHVAYRAGTAWKWEAGSQWSGDLGYTRRRFLGSLADLQASIKDLITEDRLYGTAGFMLTPRWRVRGGAEWVKWNHSDPSREIIDSWATSTTVGVDYVTPSLNSVGGQVKYTKGTYPNRQFVAGSFVDNEFNEVETSAVMRWIATGKSVLDARLGYTSRTHSQVPQRNFHGTTGRLNFDWTPTGKTLINFAAWREIRSYEDVTASYVLSNGISAGPSWAITSKIVLQATAVYEKREFKGDPGFVLTSTTQREDTTRAGRIAAGYQPLRNLEFSVAGERGKRTSNVPGADYKYNLVSANARISF